MITPTLPLLTTSPLWIFKKESVYPLAAQSASSLSIQSSVERTALIGSLQRSPGTSLSSWGRVENELGYMVFLRKLTKFLTYIPYSFPEMK